MTYEELIDKLGSIVEKNKLLLAAKDNYIFIEGKFFYETTLNKIQRLLQLYGHCEWWIYPSARMEGGVMYAVKMFKFK